jgi:hypothetical protein
VPDEFEPFSKLRDAIDRVASRLGLERKNIAFTPPEGEVPGVIHLGFTIKPEAVLTEEDLEQKNIDDQFALLTGSIDDKASEARQKLAEEANSVLDDFDDDD